MGTTESWKKLTDWWNENAKSNIKKISGGISWLLIVIITNLMTPVVAFLSGGIVDWNTYLIVVIVASIAFSVMVIESVFGKREKPSTVTTEPPQ